MPDPREDRKQKALNDFDADAKEHEHRVEEFDRRYKSYRAVVDRPEREDWMPRFHPAYVFQSVETMVANLVDPNPRWRIRVHPQMASPEQMAELREGAKANELLLRHQLTLDHWAEKQRPFDLQGLICGVTASKQLWSFREGTRRSQRFGERPVINFMGLQIGSVPEREDVAEPTVLRDDPTSEVVDVRHLIFQKGAVSLQRSERITHRVFYSFDQLKRMECRVANGKFHDGPCEPGRYYHNVDECKEKKGVAPERFTRESDLFGSSPHSGEIEVLEQWRWEGDEVRIVCIAARDVLLCDRVSPFWFDHLDHPFPFVVCSGSPDLFRIPGISEVEVMADLQEMMWTLGKQTFANIELLNNAIKLVADDVEDVEQFEVHAPGETWLVPRPIRDTVDMWSPDISGAQTALGALATLKGDLQNVTGGMPFLAGTDSSVDQTTATGVSIVTSLAQKRLAAKRQQFIWAKARIGEQWTALNQQYIREERNVPVVGEDGAEDFERIRPQILQGLFLFETEIADQSTIKAERMAQASGRFTMAVGAAPTMAAMGVPLNMRAFLDDVLDADDISDKDRYYAAAPQPQVQALPGQVPQAAPSGNGITNATLAAGPTSPSNENSISPEADMAALMRMRGQAS
jgi:hypothetical protein